LHHICCACSAAVGLAHAGIMATWSAGVVLTSPQQHPSRAVAVAIRDAITTATVTPDAGASLQCQRTYATKGSQILRVQPCVVTSSERPSLCLAC
jgi:ABC-type Zn2+ transport system substrate-binding protein/surface adhesin